MGFSRTTDTMYVCTMISFYTTLQDFEMKLFILIYSIPQKHQKPGQAGQQMKVVGQLNLRNIMEVDDSKMIISLEISLRCQKKARSVSQMLQSILLQDVLDGQPLEVQPRVAPLL